MLGSRCYNQVANMTHGAFGFHSLNRVIGGLSNRLYYSKDKGYKCCENIPQTSGKKVEPWPKADPPPPMWRCECPQDPQPPNYDPYRIKVPDVVVPPLPPSNAKEIPNEDAGELFRNTQMNFPYHCQSNAYHMQDMFRNSTLVHPDYWKDKPVRKLTEMVKETLPKLGYHGRNKYKYAFHEPWKPLDRMALLEQAEKYELEQLGQSEAKTNT